MMQQLLKLRDLLRECGVCTVTHSNLTLKCNRCFSLWRGKKMWPWVVYMFTCSGAMEPVVSSVFALGGELEDEADYKAVKLNLSLRPVVQS